MKSVFRPPEYHLTDISLISVIQPLFITSRGLHHVAVSPAGQSISPSGQYSELEIVLVIFIRYDVADLKGIKSIGQSQIFLYHHYTNGTAIRQQDVTNNNHEG